MVKYMLIIVLVRTTADTRSIQNESGKNWFSEINLKEDFCDRSRESVGGTDNKCCDNCE